MLLRQTLLYLPAQLIGPLALFVAAIVWTHLMAPDAYGLLMLAMAIQELVFGFGLSWLSLTVLRYRDALERGEGAERFRRAEATMLYVSIGAQTLGLALLLPFFDRATPEMAIAGTLFIISRSLLSHLAERARAGGAIVWYTVAQTAGPLFGFLIALLLARRFGAAPAVALAGYAAAQLAALPFVWARSGASFRPGRPARELLEPLWRYGAPLLVSSVVTWISVNGIRLVVDRMQGAVELGLMSVGWGLGQRIASTVAMLVTAAAFPLAVRAFNAGDRDGAMDQLAQNGVLLIGLLAPATAGLILIDDALIRLIVAEPYWAETIAILPFAVLSGVVRNVRVHYADQAFLLHERTGWLLAQTTVEAALTIAGAIAGALAGGVVGAVVGAFLAHLAVATFVFAQGIMMLGLRVRWADLARVAVATAAMALAVGFVPDAQSPLRLGAVVALGAGVYGAALLLLFPHAAGKLRRAVAG